MRSIRLKPAWFVSMGAMAAVVALVAPPSRTSRNHSEPLLPRPELLKVVGAAHLNLLADYYWIQCIQATGLAKTAAEYRDVYFYADLATTLDPEFELIYRFAGTSIPTNLGRETWVNTKESTALLQKGLKRFPDQLALRILLAFNLSYYERDFAGAAEVLEKAAKLPGAPRYLGLLGTRLYAKAGHVEAALGLANSLFEVESDPDVKASYAKRVKQLETERVLQQVDQLVAAYREKTGAVPVSLTQMLSAGLLQRIPIDPMGGSIFLDEKGVAQTTAEVRLEVKTDSVQAQDSDSP